MRIRVTLWGMMLVLAAACPAWGRDMSEALTAQPAAAPVELFPGVWKIRVGSPEKYVPSFFRITPPREESLRRLPASKLPFDLAALGMTVSSSRTVLEIPCPKSAAIRFNPAIAKPGDVVTISVEDSKEPGARYIFQSDDLKNLPLNTMHDDADGALVTRSPGWTSYGPNEHTKAHYGGTFINSREAGASLEIPFTGEFFRIFAFKAPNRGIAEIYVDGELMEAVDTSAPKDQPAALVYEKYGFKNAPHVVRFVVSGRKSERSTGTEVSFDAMESGVGVATMRASAKKEGIFGVKARSLAGSEVAFRSLRVGMTRPGAGVEFSSSNPMLQRIFDAIILANLKNEERMPDGRKVLVEGDIWRGVWLETQPMGGAMYGKFDLEIARNNLEVVIDGQLANGMLPHLTHLNGTQWNGAIGFNAVAQYGLDAYYLFNKDPAFLDKLEKALTRYDAFLWKAHDRNGNGVLEAYGSTDTGEDGQAGNRYDLPRDSDGKRFVESVSVMADSYANRAVLARIAALKGDEAGRKQWQAKAEALRKKTREYFWVEERKAAFDRNAKEEILPTLNQLNIRAMTQGLFTQQMAEDFVRQHLMNPSEFFTPYPIPSTAINDPTFHNVDKATEYSTWAGPSMGLTLQRSVRALENYGHYVEIALIGQRLLERIGREPVNFPVQFNPITGEAVARAGGYGPMILATMEYLSRMYGVYVDRDRIVWNGLSVGDGESLEYRQLWYDKEFRLLNKGGRVVGFVNGVKVFEVPNGLRVETDYDGKALRVVGIDAKKISGTLVFGADCLKEFSAAPNQAYAVEAGAVKKEKSPLFFAGQ